jgi:hypothetical protein
MKLNLKDAVIVGTWLASSENLYKTINTKKYTPETFATTLLANPTEIGSMFLWAPAEEMIYEHTGVEVCFYLYGNLDSEVMSWFQLMFSTMLSANQKELEDFL